VARRVRSLLDPEPPASPAGSILVETTGDLDLLERLLPQLLPGIRVAAGRQGIGEAR